MLNDEKYYLQVEKELKDSIRDEALWSKSVILAKDDEAEAKVQYIKTRVVQLQKEVFTLRLGLLLHWLAFLMGVGYFLTAFVLTIFGEEARWWAPLLGIVILCVLNLLGSMVRRVLVGRLYLFPFGD